MIEYKNVHKKFQNPVLSGLDLSVECGETLAIFGPSGTGKSVLLKSTIGLIQLDGGDIVIEGLSIVNGTQKEIEKIRRKIGYVFQNAALFDSMSIYENVLYGIHPDEQKSIPAEEKIERVESALLMVNLTPEIVLRKMPSELSGGMRKRVGIARAIIGKPRILLYDEPVTGLDPVNSSVIHSLIDKLKKESGMTSVIVTHDIPGTLPIADKIVLLDSGMINFEGTPQQFAESDNMLVKAFFNKQLQSP